MTTIFLALSGSASELSSLSKDELDSMKDGFQSFFAGRTLSTSFQSVAVSVMFDGDYIIEQQQEQVKEQENSKRSLQDGALRLVLEIQTVVRNAGDKNIDETIVQAVKDNSESFQEAISSSTESIGELTGSLGSLKDILLSASPSDKPSGFTVFRTVHIAFYCSRPCSGEQSICSPK